VGAAGGKPTAEAAGGIPLAQERQTSDAIEGERKTVMALFADIKGSTELMRDLDPEEARTVLDPVLQLMIRAMHRSHVRVAAMRVRPHLMESMAGSPKDSTPPI
jgi:class 3 adenylate cyclase